MTREKAATLAGDGDETPPAGTSMQTLETEKVVRQFFADLRLALNGEIDNPYRSFHPDVEFIVRGQTPSSGTWRGMRSVAEDFLAEVGHRMGRGPGHGLFPLEYIAEGGKCAVRALGRGSNARGRPYNNSYLFWFEVRDGMITRFIEDFDSALAWQAIYDCDLVEAAE